MKLREYQLKAMSDVADKGWKHKKILLVAPTGSGKTVIASALIQVALEKGHKCLFVAHRRELIMQCSKKLHDFDVNHGVIMAGKSATPRAKTQVASIQTFTIRSKKEDFIKPEATLIILDEAHRSASKSFQDLMDLYPNAMFIGLTATPCRNDGKGLGSIYTEMVECSNIKELTELGFLVPTKIIAPTLPDLQGLRMLAGDYENRGLDKRVNTPKLVGDLVTHWLRHAKDRTTVVFAVSIAHSKYIAKIFNENGIPAGHIDGEMDELERERVLHDLKVGHIKVLSNCQVLTEGWDMPIVSCVVLARPTKSYGMYLQMVGRSLRPAEDKEDTLILDHAGCVYEHGFPADTPEWELTKSKIKRSQEPRNRPIEKQPFTCVKCNTVYQPSRYNRECPNCGYVLNDIDKKVLVKQGRLVEVESIEVKLVNKKDWYAQLLYFAKQKGYKEGWASHTFRKKFGHFPHSKRVFPKPISKEVEGYIKHLYIKNAKGGNYAGYE
ncbi:MAG: putative ATP-dependent DNA helicase [Prokaryotic dsDNA virus sp.]|nr:MAG: putative ATP-dependent DNA helicase [Prokaryotic dsDNA virus sp.]QDP60048.1 MAG: putative ATP-dependent DNA helicase [Prokaryotic dsDNA virus sp.]QDP67116.1 MAG: putative ATP-dependent DNA helicase [Prokaryotic dsDNA virus sp.]|tara:strand:+ start:8429 stop:9913 length:1485 start_codon:yes stop_codon:yes gene_type:complete